MSATTIERLAIEVTAEEADEPSVAAIAAHALQSGIDGQAMLDTARIVLLGALADLFVALNQVEGMRLVRAMLAGNVQPGGARVPGTSYEFEPCAAATAIGLLISGAEQPAQCALRTESLGALLAVADFEDRKRAWRGAPPLTMRELLDGLIRAERVRCALEQTSALAMRELDCLLGATAVAALSLLPGAPVRIGEALQRVWRSAGAPAMPAAELHAEAVRRSLGVHDLRFAAPTGTSIPCEVFQAFPIARGPGYERSLAVQRFEAAVQTRLSPKQCDRIKAIVGTPGVLDAMAVNAFVAELVANQS